MIDWPTNFQTKGQGGKMSLHPLKQTPTYEDGWHAISNKKRRAHNATFFTEATPTANRGLNAVLVVRLKGCWSTSLIETVLLRHPQDFSLDADKHLVGAKAVQSQSN